MNIHGNSNEHSWQDKLCCQGTIKAEHLFNKVSKESLQKSEDAATNTFIPVCLPYLVGHSGYEIQLVLSKREEKGFWVCTFKVYKSTRIISLFSFVFFASETAFADNYGRPIVGHLPTANRYLSILLLSKCAEQQKCLKVS